MPCEDNKIIRFKPSRVACVEFKYVIGRFLWIKKSLAISHFKNNFQL